MLKDRLILRRRKSCCISLLTLPPLFFFLATLQYILIDTNKISGELMTENFYYSTNQAQNITVQGAPLTIPASYLEGSVNMPSGASNVGLSTLLRGQPVTSLSKCYESQNTEGNPYSKFAIITNDNALYQEADLFF